MSCYNCLPSPVTRASHVLGGPKELSDSHQPLIPDWAWPSLSPCFLVARPFVWLGRDCGGLVECGYGGDFVTEARQPALDESWLRVSSCPVSLSPACAPRLSFPSPGRTGAEHSHPEAGSPHPESHRTLSHVFPHCRPHTKGKARPVLG